MKMDVTEELYEHYTQMPRHRELQETCGCEISNAWRNGMMDAIQEGDYLKAQELALYFSGKAEKVGFILGFQIGVKLMCESLGEEVERRVMTMEEPSIFLQYAKKTYYGDIFEVVLSTGMRKGYSHAR